jgi:hypothetical protein
MPDTESDDSAGHTLPGGICVNCKQSRQCLFLKNTRQPIWFCEMFEKNFTGEPEKSKTELAVPELPETSRLIGLCVTCEKRETCTLPKPESGVWHCEEYA